MLSAPGGGIGTPSFDPPEALRVLWRRKLLFLVLWGAATFVGLGAAFLLKPVFSSSVTLLLEEPGPLGAAGAERWPGADGAADVMGEQVESRLFLLSVLTSTGVRNDPGARAWALRSAGRQPGVSDDQRVDDFLVHRLKNGITIRRGRGNVFRVTVEDHDRERARKLAAGVAEPFVMVSTPWRREGVGAQEIASGIGSAIPAARLPRVRTLLEQASIEADDLQQRVARMGARLKGPARENDPQLLTGPRASALEAQIRSLERQLASAEVDETAARTGAADVRLAIARRLSELEVELGVNALKAFPMLSPDVRQDLVTYRVALADLGGVEARKEWLAGQVGSAGRPVGLPPDPELERPRLGEAVDGNRQLYPSFLQRSTLAQIAEALENAKVGGRFVVLEPATRSHAPARPNRPILILLSMLVGTVLGTGAVLLVERHDQSVRNAEEVESLLGLPVLAAIPRVERPETSRRRGRPSHDRMLRESDQGLLQRLKAESPLGLEFRRATLKLKARHRPLPRSMVVTSATRGEGKTTTAACLAITLARELKERVLLADFDLRSPSLHRALGLPSSSWGLAQMLARRHFDERFVRGTAMLNLEFLPAGRSESPAGEPIDEERVEWFVQEVTRRYPMVILDAAPNLAVPDPLILGRAVEGVLYVIKAGSTVRKAAEYGVKVQREARDNLLGVLINDLGEVLPQHFGYRYDYYGYKTEASGAE
jgi:Mrp family chromosome partitioning ATPase